MGAWAQISLSSLLSPALAIRIPRTAVQAPATGRRARGAWRAELSRSRISQFDSISRGDRELPERSSAIHIDVYITMCAGRCDVLCFVARARGSSWNPRRERPETPEPDCRHTPHPLRSPDSPTREHRDTHSKPCSCFALLFITALINGTHILYTPQAQHSVATGTDSNLYGARRQRLAALAARRPACPIGGSPPQRWSRRNSGGRYPWASSTAASGEGLRAGVGIYLYS